MIVFELDGSRYQALNGDATPPSREAVSLMVTCRDPGGARPASGTRIADGGGKPQMCGWIKDRYGLPWQVVPARTGEWLTGDRPPPTG